MKTTAKIISALLVITLFVGMIPASLAETSSRTGSHWYASRLNTEFMDEDEIDEDMQIFLDTLAYFVKFVPYERYLRNLSILSFYCGIDFYVDGTFDFTMAYSAWGEEDLESVTRMTGNWIAFGDTMIMEMDGVFLPLSYENGVLSLSILGFGLDFVQATQQWL